MATRFVAALAAAIIGWIDYKSTQPNGGLLYPPTDPLDPVCQMLRVSAPGRFTKCNSPFRVGHVGGCFTEFDT